MSECNSEPRKLAHSAGRDVVRDRHGQFDDGKPAEDLEFAKWNGV